MGLFRVSCEAGTYIRTLCTHIGLYLDNGATMKELRRIRSGLSYERDSVTMHDILDAQFLYEKMGDESALRKVIKPLETLLVNYRRVIIKDSAVDAICNGAQLTVSGILKYEEEMNVAEEVIAVTMKGEAVALMEALVAGSQIGELQYGKVFKTKRVIMEMGLYERAWGSSKEFDILSSDTE